MANFTIEVKVAVSPEQMSDIMVTALEGGINYWCSEVGLSIPKGVSLRTLASDCISKGGALSIYLMDDEGEPLYLTEQKLVNGFKRYMMKYAITSISDLVDNHDASTADEIVQYALFNEIVYG